MSDTQKRSFPIQLIAIPALILTLIFSAVFFITESKKNRIYSLTSYDLVIPDDSISIDHGKRIYTIRGCIDCHGQNLGGKIIESGFITGVIAAPNLTPGSGSAIKDYSDSDLVRVIREGIRPDGRSVLFMPSHKFQVIHKTDIEALVAYMKSVSPIERGMPITRLTIPLRFYHFVNRNLALFPATMVQRPVDFEEEISMSRLEKGKYIASSCVGCHGYKLEGGRVPGAPPYWPIATDLTTTGIAGSWSKEEFIESMQKGITPDGRHLDSRYMPWEAFGQLNKEEFELLWEYMKSL